LEEKMSTKLIKEYEADLIGRGVTPDATVAAAIAKKLVDVFVEGNAGRQPTCLDELRGWLEEYDEDSEQQARCEVLKERVDTYTGPAADFFKAAYALVSALHFQYGVSKDWLRDEADMLERAELALKSKDDPPFLAYQGIDESLDKLFEAATIWRQARGHTSEDLPMVAIDVGRRRAAGIAAGDRRSPDYHAPTPTVS
jgi:hypothetical protein